MCEIFKLKIWRTSLVVIAAIVLVSSAVVFYGLKKEIKISQAGAGHNILGFAWSKNIGWISFNSSNCDTDSNGFVDTDAIVQGCGGDNSTDIAFDYGVNVDLDSVSPTFEELSGYAWSKNIGWISFDKTIAGNPPSVPYNAAETFMAKLNTGTGEFSGWARALSACQDNLWDGAKCTGVGAGNKSGGWDGWIKLRKDPADPGPDYGVSLNSADFEGWAWGGNVAGWISFNSNNTGAVNPYKVYLVEAKTWAKAYGGNSGDKAGIIHQAPDGKYFMAGYTESFGVNGEDAYFAKIDQDGNFLWANAYGGNEDEFIHLLQKISDGNYIAMGTTTDSGGAGSKDILVMKLDPSGTLIWARAFGGNEEDFLRNRTIVYETSTGDFIMAGQSSSFDDGGADALILKLDSSGHLSKMKNFGEGSYDTFREVKKTSDGNYIAVGSTKSYADSNGNSLIVKFDSDLNRKWAKEYGRVNLLDAAVNIRQTDGGYIVFGYSETSAGGPQEFIVMKIDSFGVLDWAKAYKKADLDSDHARFSCETSDGGFVLSGVSYDGMGGANLLLVKIDSNGDQKWARTFGGDASDELVFIEQTSDGGYIISGSTHNFGVSGEDALVIKLDQNGNIQDCTPPLKGIGEVPSSDVTGEISETIVIDEFNDVTFSMSESNINFTTTPLIPFTETDACVACNTDPTVIPAAPSIPTDWCASSPGSIKLPWAFSDTEDDPAGIPQTAYRIDLSRSDGNTCTSGKQGSPAVPDDTGNLSGAEINLFPGCANFIDYGNYTYNWSMTVWDSADTQSVTVGGTPFGPTPIHQYPTANFSYSPPLPLIQFQNITFDPLTAPNDSQAYGGASIVSFEWDFEDDGVVNDVTFPPPADPTVVHFYSVEDTFTIDLRVTDSDGFNCWASQHTPVNTEDITIGENMPEWNETMP